MNKPEKNVFARFDERKEAVKIESLKDEHTKLDQQQEASTEFINTLTDADMPDIGALNEESDYSVFMSDKVSEALKKKALRKLFLSPSINVLDGLNDYDEDYTTFDLLGGIIPHDLKQQIERESKEATEKNLEENQKEQQETLKSATNETQPTNNANKEEDEVIPTLTTKDQDKDNDNKHKQLGKTTST